MLIGVTGLARSGKDTFYQLAKEIYPEASRRAFADKLKESAASLLGVTTEFLNETKSDAGVQVQVVRQWEDADDILYRYTIREYLQRYGTEAHRNIFGKDFWLEQCLPDDESFEGRLVIVTDVRFDNEAEWIQGFDGGFVVRIRRSEVERGDAHASETPISNKYVDYEIINNNTLDDYKISIGEVIDHARDLYGD